MPKQTFFNLSEGKRSILIEAAKLEFSRVPLYEASINNIIKTAEISRGSFYQYFEDKEDLYFYVLDAYIKETHQQLHNYLKETGGDLLESFHSLFQYLWNRMNTGEENNFFRNALLNMNYQVERALSSGQSVVRHWKDLRQLMQAIAKRNFPWLSEESMLHTLELLMAITLHHVVHHYTSGKNYEAAMEAYRFKLGLIEKGLSLTSTRVEA